VLICIRISNAARCGEQSKLPENGVDVADGDAGSPCLNAEEGTSGNLAGPRKLLLAQLAPHACLLNALAQDDQRLRNFEWDSLGCGQNFAR